MEACRSLEGAGDAGELAPGGDDVAGRPERRRHAEAAERVRRAPRGRRARGPRRRPATRSQARTPGVIATAPPPVTRRTISRPCGTGGAVDAVRLRRGREGTQAGSGAGAGCRGCGPRRAARAAPRSPRRSSGRPATPVSSRRSACGHWAGTSSTFMRRPLAVEEVLGVQHGAVRDDLLAEVPERDPRRPRRAAARRSRSVRGAKSAPSQSTPAPSSSSATPAQSSSSPITWNQVERSGVTRQLADADQHDQRGEAAGAGELLRDPGVEGRAAGRCVRPRQAAAPRSRAPSGRGTARRARRRTRPRRRRARRRVGLGSPPRGRARPDRQHHGGEAVGDVALRLGGAVPGRPRAAWRRGRPRRRPPRPRRRGTAAATVRIRFSRRQAKARSSLSSAARRAASFWCCCSAVLGGLAVAARVSR